MTAEEKLLDNGYEDVIILRDFSYDDALVGVTEDNRAVYDFNLMVVWLQENEGMDETEAIEWIEYNTIRAIALCGRPSAYRHVPADRLGGSNGKRI